MRGASLPLSCPRPALLSRMTPTTILHLSLVRPGANQRLPGAWCYTQGDPDIVVAVLSTGIDMDHPEFAGRIVPGYDFANDDDDPSDDHGIGTHEAGIIAAGIDNGIGIAGIAGNVKIMPVKVLSMMGSPPAPIGSFSDVADGIVWAVDQGAQILYLGATGPSESVRMREAVDYAEDQGVFVVAPSGNYGADTPFYPAVYTSTLGVGATSYTGSRWSNSNYGPNVDVMAPGSPVISTFWTEAGSGEYTALSGTSPAAAHVAGVAALMLSMDETLTPAEIRTILSETALDMGDPGYDELHGHGRIDALTALMSLQYDCSTVTEIPQDECEALIALYGSTDGDNWTDNTDWLVTDTPVAGTVSPALAATFATWCFTTTS